MRRYLIRIFEPKRTTPMYYTEKTPWFNFHCDRIDAKIFDSKKQADKVAENFNYLVEEGKIVLSVILYRVTNRNLETLNKEKEIK